MSERLHPGQKEGRAEERLFNFVNALIQAGVRPYGGNGIRWQPFQVRAIVEAELATLGFDLCEDGAVHDPKLRRFYAAKKVKP